MRTVTAGALALAVALSGPIAWAQETSQETAPPTTETTAAPTTTPAETPTETPVETPTGTPAETTGETPAETTTTPPAETTSEASPTTTTAEPAPDVENPAEPDGPPQVAPPTARPDLRASIAFDRSEYAPDSDIGFTVTVSNVGNAPAVDVRVMDSGDLWLKSGSTELRRIPGPTLAPGESRTYRLVGRQSDRRSATVRYSVDFRTGAQQSPSTDPTPNDNRAEATATVPQARGSAKGLIYRDANGNGRFDDGEGVSGMPVYAMGGAPDTWLSGVTDASGRFDFGTDIPTGQYRAYLQTYQNPDVIAAGRATFTIQAGVAANLEFPLAPPVSNVLVPRIEFDRDTYLPTDPVGITVTLTNTGTTPLTGVVAVCDESWSDGILNGRTPAWAELSPEGPGTALAAGETKVLTITETVTEDAKLSGRLWVSCNFGNSGRATAGYRGSSDSAEVGAFGAVEGTLKFDDGDGEDPLDGARLVALNRRTALNSAEAVSRDGGSFTFARLPAGTNRVLLLGDYQDKATGNGWFTVDVVAGTTTRVELVAVPGPRVTEPVSHNKLEVTASFDKSSYAFGEPVTAKVKITNAGAGYRAEVRFEPEHSSSTMYYNMDQWGPLYRLYNPTGERLYLWPGESYEVTLVGEVAWTRDDTVRLKGQIRGDYSDMVAPIDLSAAVTYPKGDATVVIYGDANANGALDAGESPLSDVAVSLSGGMPNSWHSGRTDVDGRYRAEGIATGNYSVYTWDADGWIPAEGSYNVLTVTENGDTTFETGLVRPLSDGLGVELAFDQPSYQPTDTPKLHVAITNNTGRDLTVSAHCGGYGWAHEIYNGPEWGALGYGGPGVPVANGTTWTTTVAVPMPEASPDHGLITAACQIGPRAEGGGIVNGSPFGKAKARVPGAVWTTTGTVELANAYPRVPVPNVKLVLLDPDTQQPVARTTTDADGAFTFPDLPVGHYTPVVVGPWKVHAYTSGPLFAAIRGAQYPERILVEPGPEVADPDLAAPGGNPGGNPGGAGQQPVGISGPSGGALATTGASVLGLSLVGLLLLAFGIGARTMGRRTA